MEVRKLRSHIPISGPAWVEEADGFEPSRVTLGFEPAWFHRRCMVDFSERWHIDPYYRYETMVTMRQTLIRAFPAASCWETGTEPATISGCFGAYFVPLAFGCSLRYEPDRWPNLDLSNKPLFSDKVVEKLEPQKVLSSPAVEQLFRQMDLIGSEWGTVHGYLNWQGILNNAFHLRGESIFTDLYDKPELVHHLFGVICEVMIWLAKMVQGKQRKTGFYTDNMLTGNCTVNMISPEAYEEFVLPYDRRLAVSFERFGVHTCNWDVTPYISALSKLPRVGYLDMGMMSDLPRVRAMFPDTRRAVFYSPIRLEEADLVQIETDLVRIKREVGPCDVIMADIQASTPDRRVNEFVDIFNKVNRREAV